MAKAKAEAKKVEAEAEADRARGILKPIREDLETKTAEAEAAKAAAEEAQRKSEEAQRKLDEARATVDARVVEAQAAQTKAEQERDACLEQQKALQKELDECLRAKERVQAEVLEAEIRRRLAVQNNKTALIALDGTLTLPKSTIERAREARAKKRKLVAAKQPLPKDLTAEVREADAQVDVLVERIEEQGEAIKIQPVSLDEMQSLCLTLSLLLLIQLA